ncbi:nuclear transport factor 2 family protein [Staphylococcus sp. SQ8-PEA]|uniref:Nuclear transport factor 2 family protein n=1 Tax=Staphylococcus marylandisciuri TaxID=2981529 RepID=A0ABT2QRA8_9STAP|nr:nuclear transport factor 2 family protein [Staphylococcus marylandisciuri]MCU5746512.1 nuclear transport factor 2 family protein [Staphylococcus marylandisciuri]
MKKSQIQDRIRQVYDDILINLRLETIDEYFAADYKQVTDHHEVDLNGFKEHMAKLKSVVKKMNINEFTDQLIDEDQKCVFLRYNVHVEKKDSSDGLIEVYALFKFNDEGKIKACHELTQAYQTHVEGLGSI